MVVDGINAKIKEVTVDDLGSTQMLAKNGGPTKGQLDGMLLLFQGKKPGDRITRHDAVANDPKNTHNLTNLLTSSIPTKSGAHKRAMLWLCVCGCAVADAMTTVVAVYSR